MLISAVCTLTLPNAVLHMRVYSRIRQQNSRRFTPRWFVEFDELHEVTLKKHLIFTPMNVIPGQGDRGHRSLCDASKVFVIALSV